jgi:transketolase
MTEASDQAALDKLCVDTIRTLSMDAVQQANSGHPGTPMALAPFAYVLYTRVMRHAPEHPRWPARDRFVLSAGHASMLLYSTLYLTGYGISLDDIKRFRQLHSPAAGHPEYGDAPGIETTTGPLGQGIATAVGMALAERMLEARFPGLQEHFTYTVASDGDMQEGVQSEAASIAGHLGLGRLIAVYDDNHISIEGDTGLSFSEDVGARYEAYGWHVQNLGEDFPLDRIESALEAAQAESGRPSLIIARTHIAPGAPNKQDTAAAHGAPLGEEEIRATKQHYGWPSTEPFHVPEEALAHFRRCVDRGGELVREWEERTRGHEGRDELRRMLARELPPGWDGAVPTKSAEDGGSVATRKASNEAIQWAAGEVSELVGGSADLAESNLTLIDGAESVARGAYAGRNLHFGIREHAMGAIVNGLTLSGFRGYGGTFLIFSDYMKAAVRLSALMGIPSIFVYTHDSIGLGEDGPTHQPIEQLATLRATPQLYTVRPADFNETAQAWAFALRSTDRPTCLAFSRQGVPTLDGVAPDAVERGGYVLRDAEDEPEVILIGTGTEVSVCLDAAELLGPGCRVVSMPCVERFAEQDADYRDEVLPPGVRARVAVEAAATFGWHRWVGDDGDVVGMEGFGASAPAKDLYAHFGFTGEAVAERAQAVMGRQVAR